MRPELAVELDRVGVGGDSARYAAWIAVWLANTEATRWGSGSYNNGDGFGHGDKCGDGDQYGDGRGQGAFYSLGGDGFGWGFGDGRGDGRGDGFKLVAWSADAP